MGLSNTTLMGAAPESLESIRRLIVAGLRAHGPKIERAIGDRIRDAVPHVGNEDPDYEAGLLEAITAIVDYSFHAIEQGPEWSEQIPLAAIAQARRAARAGISVGTVQRRYIAGHRELGNFIAHEIERNGLSNNGQVMHHMRTTQEELLEHLIAAIEREYLHESNLLTGRNNQRRLETVQRLLAGEDVEQREVDELQYQLHACWHLGVIATGNDAVDVLCHLRAALRCRLLRVKCGDGAVWGWFGAAHELVMGDLERLLSTDGHSDCRLVIGGTAMGLKGWRQTHREARDALAIALRSSRRIVRYADSPLVAAAVQNDTLTRWLQEFVYPLRSQKDGGEGLRRTLRALIDAECNRRAAASALEIDRHTVESRLRTAERLLGRTLHTCLPELDIALRLEELDGAARIPATCRNGQPDMTHLD